MSSLIKGNYFRLIIHMGKWSITYSNYIITNIGFNINYRNYCFVLCFHLITLDTLLYAFKCPTYVCVFYFLKTPCANFQTMLQNLHFKENIQG